MQQTNKLIVIKTPDELREFGAQVKKAGARVGFVPTMGALHKGHISLIELIKGKADIIICSIFVNPMQFGANEDLSRYPRSEEQDCQLLEAAGCNAVYLPSVSAIYPEDFKTKVTVDGLSDVLCGKFRSGHFDGVATVVTKLLMQVLPDFAAFGEKDFQQLQIIRTLVRDLNIPVEILAGETLRESDGLALSSRNQYLSASERAIAPMLYRELIMAKREIINGADLMVTLQLAKNNLQAAGFSKIDYLEYVDSKSLNSLTKYQNDSRLLVAAYIGNTRLIDNIKVS